MFTLIKNRTKGFTLIELLVVIAIIGILSSVVLASLGTARQKARDATRISDMKNIQLALEVYVDTRQAYVGQVLAASYLATPLFTLAGWTTLPLVGPGAFIPSWPIDPSIATRGATYAYAYMGTNAAGDTTCFGAIAGNQPVACLGYLLGATLERNDNPVIAKDVDTVLGTFSGADTGSCGAVADTAQACFAVRP